MSEHENEKEADINFLLDRAMSAGTCSFSTGSFSTGRDFGASSNSIVGIAYGRSLDTQVLPLNLSDLAACERMWAKLPLHRKTRPAEMAMNAARSAVCA